MRRSGKVCVNFSGVEMTEVKKLRLDELKGWKKLRTALSYVIPYFRPYKRSVILVAVLAFFSTLFDPSLVVSIKLFMQWVAIQEHPDPRWAIAAPLFMVYLMLFRETTTFLYEYNREKLSLRVVQDLQCAVYNHFVHLSVDHYDKMSTGEMMSRTVRDVSRMQDTVPMVIDFSKHLLKFLSLAICCILMQPALTLISFVALPLTALAAVRIGNLMKTYTKKGLKQAAVINIQMQETYSGARIVKAFAQEDAEVKRYWDKMLKMLKIQFKYSRSKYLQGPAANLISSLGVALVMGIAIYWTLQKVNVISYAGWFFSLFGFPVHQTVELAPRLSWPNFWAFFTALGLMINPIRDLARVQGNFQTTYGSIERTIEVFEKEATVKEKPNAIELEPMSKEIRYENVYFKYEDQWALKDFSFVAKKGELVALVGPSGSGKTTVVNLLPRFYDVSKGKITIDGIDIRDVTLKSLRSQIGIVTQETFLFNDTVENNIKYGSPEKNLDQIIEAAKAANAHEFILGLPQGYQTIIGERGVRLSGGEKQRIAIARALLKNPPILLLDEATSSLDTEAEREVQKALDVLMKNRTTIAIAHRLSTIRNANLILVISNGEIVEQGTHDELIQKQGLYRKLYEMQFLIHENPELKAVCAEEALEKKIE